METFQWLRDVLKSPRGTPSNTPPATPRSAQGGADGDEVHEAVGPRDAAKETAPAASASASTGSRTAAAQAASGAADAGRGAAGEAAQQAETAQHWRVVWPSGVNVRRTKDISSDSCGTRERGTIVLGREEHGWVALSDEPGFMAIASGSSTLLEKTSSEIHRWEVVSQSGVYVRQAKDLASESLGFRERGTVVFGHEEDGWVSLSDELGFIVVSNGGCALLEKLSQAPELEVMMAAAEARRQEVEAQATRLVALLSGVGSPDAAAEVAAPAPGSSSAGQSLSSGSLPNLITSSTATKRLFATGSSLSVSLAEPDSPLLSASPAEFAPIMPSGNATSVPAMFGTPEAKIADSPAAFGAKAESPSSAVAAAATAHSAVPESPLQSALSESLAPPPPLSLANPKVFSAGLSIPAPPWRSTSTLRSRSGPPPSRQLPEPALVAESQLALNRAASSQSPRLERCVRHRLSEAKGKVDEVMNEMADVRSRLGSQETRISSLTRSLQDISREASAAPGERGRLAQPGSSGNDERDVSPSLRPEVCTLFKSMVEEMSQMSELAARGEQASRQVEDARLHLENLHLETASLGLRSGTQPSIAGSSADQANELLLTFRRELSEAVGSLRRQDLSSLRDDMDTLKEQLRLVTDAAGNSKQVAGEKVDSADDRFLLLSSDVTALRGTLSETVGMLRTELCHLADQAPQVTRQDLDDALLQMRQDVARSLSTATESLREENSHLAANSALTAGSTPRGSEHELAGVVSELRARLNKVSGDMLDARRGFDSLQEDFSAMQTRKMVTQQELGKTTEFLNKEFRLMLDMTMHNFHSATRQELAQTSSQLRRELRPLADFGANEGEAATRRELREAIDQLRKEMEPQKPGEHETHKAMHPTWEELVSVVEHLSEDVAQLGEKSSQGEQAVSADLSRARQILAGLEEDVNILKAQRSLQGVDKDDLEHLLQGQQEGAIERLKEEVTTLLRQDIARFAAGDLADALARAKGSPPGHDTGGGEAVVMRRELEEVIDGIRHEVALMVNGKSQGGDSVTRQELADLVDSIMGEVSKRIDCATDMQSRTGDNADASEMLRNLARLSEDVAFLKVRHGVLGEEAAQERAAVEQRFRVVQHELSSASGQLRVRGDSAQQAQSTTERDFLTQSDLRDMADLLRQEFYPLRDSCTDIKRQLRELQEGAPGEWPNINRLPAVSPASPESCSSPAFSRALASPPGSANLGLRARGELLDTQKDFGSLRDDLSSLKSRQEFLKQELKCLVDSASKS